MKPIDIPDGIDDPPQFLLWSLDELMPIVLALGAGILIEQVLICLLGAIGLVKIYRRYRDAKPDGFMLHSIYWAGFLPSKSKTVPNPFVRRFLP
ncbi:type IV conjugative transfer system protein TraL [Kistimonas scapharcae]|uniref:type IV conjugative transfer system protein TraL n=1 Tax=Kistimonas scapharcae TaxID=1036133 RepID=UPI0031F0E08D